jgi:hypothetical protein
MVFAAFRSSSAVQANRRAHERRRVRFGSFIAVPDASRWVKCQTIDLSFAGARVHMDEMPSLPEAVYFLQLQDRLAYEARIVWRKAPEMGLQFNKVYRFDEVPGAPLRGLIDKVSA